MCLFFVLLIVILSADLNPLMFPDQEVNWREEGSQYMRVMRNYLYLEKIPMKKDYLTGMPALDKAAGQRTESMRGVRLFLIHHITAEVIGLLKAFEAAGCDTLTTFFVKYAGIVPETYLETLMSLPPEIF